MEVRTIRHGFRQALAAFRSPIPTCIRQQPRRYLATPSEQNAFEAPPIQAAPEFQFGDDFVDPPSQVPDDLGQSSRGNNYSEILPKLRIVPASPSYFTGKPDFTDDLLYLEGLLRKYQTLPVLQPGHAPRIAWKTLPQYRSMNNESVKAARYNKIVQVLGRLNYILRSLMPDEVQDALKAFMRDIQPFANKPKPVLVDQSGRARGVGRRKSSHAVAHLVEGEGEVLINGKTLTEAFGRIHDRESAIWALKATERIDKYNVWAIVKGGGTTGQAEALTLAVAKALMVHEPDLKPALRRAGCVTRDPRKVERKKPGKLKARKMPAWVKR